eukprot:3535648-Pyramimonas_sp.AAC.1
MGKVTTDIKEIKEEQVHIKTAAGKALVTAEKALAAAEEANKIGATRSTSRAAPSNGSTDVPPGLRSALQGGGGADESPAKLVIGGFEAYSEQDEMQPFVDMIL